MLMSEYPVVSVHIPPILRPLAEGRDEIMASGETVGEVLEAVGHEYPALGESLFCADRSLADGLAVYFGGTVLHGRESLRCRSIRRKWSASLPSPTRVAQPAWSTLGAPDTPRRARKTRP